MIEDASGPAELVDLGNPVTSSASGQPEETQHHSCLPSSSRVPNRVESQSSTQTTGNPLLSGPYLEVNQSVELDAPQSRGAKNGRKGLKGRDASLLTFNKKKGVLETLKRNSAVKDSQAVGDAERVLELPESTSATLGSMAFLSGPPIETSKEDRNSNTTAVDQTSHVDTECLLLGDYEVQNQPCPSSPSIE